MKVDLREEGCQVRRRTRPLRTSRDSTINTQGEYSSLLLLQLFSATSFGMSDLHDVSTSSGAVSLFFFRWKNAIWSLLVTATILMGVAYLFYKYVPLGEGIPESTFVTSGSKLMYYGNESKFEDRHFDVFPGLPNVSEPIDTIEIKWSRVEGANLTSALREFYPSLKRLHLDNVTLEGSLEPVALGSLEEFYLKQGLEPEERNATKYSLAKAKEDPSWLHSTLFFLNDSTSDFPSKAAVTYGKGINVTIYLKGSIAYKLNPEEKEVRLDISDCSEILDKLRNNYTSVTLGRCRDLRVDSIAPSTTVLNFYIVYVTSETLSGIFKNLPNLEEFVAEIPIPNVAVNLEDFGPKIRIISVSSMKIEVPSSGLSLPSVREFYFGQENQYSWLPSRVTTLNDTFFTNFPILFPSVERVGLFDLRDERRYESLAKVMRTPSVTWLLVENFARIANGNETIRLESESVSFVEAELRDAGLQETEETFLLTISGGGAKVGRTLSKEEKLWYRYKYLGWRPIDSWPKYLYVQRIIEGGGIL